MSIIIFTVLGAVLGWAFKWPIMLLVITGLALAIGIEGALYGRPLSSVFMNAVMMQLVVQGSYAASALMSGYVSSRTASRKA